jgi:hypothetical protein
MQSSITDDWLHLSRKRKMSGFGHRVYKNYDPRAKVTNLISYYHLLCLFVTTWENLVLKTFLLRVIILTILLLLNYRFSLFCCSLYICGKLEVFELYRCFCGM